MSYLNGQIGYRTEMLETRSVVKKDNWVVIDPDGIVSNSIPGYVNCDATILASPAMGADFADYLVTAHKGGKHDGIGGEGIESFLYVISGEVSVSNGEKSADLTAGGYIFSPADKDIAFENKSDEDAQMFVYRRRYVPLEGHEAYTVCGNINEVEWSEYEGMANCHVKDFLPKDFGFDMNMHILKFKLGASHGYIETHIQEHGAYILSGKGMYLLDDTWIPVKKGDYLFMDAYCPQACYAVGDEGIDEDLAYIYSKDCNREVAL